MNDNDEVHFGEWVLVAEGVASNLPSEMVLSRAKAKTMADLRKARKQAITVAKKRGASLTNLRVTAMLTKTDSRTFARRPYKVQFMQNEMERPIVYVHDLDYWRERIKPSTKKFAEK